MNPDYIYIKESNIPNAGKGAFAKKRIKGNTKIGEYTGDLHIIENETQKDELLKHADQMGCGQYLMRVNLNGNRYGIIDGGDHSKLANWTRYINGVKSEDQMELINCYFYQYGGHMFIKTFREINPDEELIINYGPLYNWE